jgi:hypothetical protein
LTLVHQLLGGEHDGVIHHADLDLVAFLYPQFLPNSGRNSA